MPRSARLMTAVPLLIGTLGLQWQHHPRFFGSHSENRTLVVSDAGAAAIAKTNSRVGCDFQAGRFHPTPKFGEARQSPGLAPGMCTPSTDFWAKPWRGPGHCGGLSPPRKGSQKPLLFWVPQYVGDKNPTAPLVLWPNMKAAGSTSRTPSDGRLFAEDPLL